MTTGTRKTGQFCWINILSPRPKDATGFFGKLLGWSFGEIPGMGYSITVGGKDIGGLFDVLNPQTNESHAPVVGVMVKAASADAISARANELGGKGLPAFDIMDRGRMAVLFDQGGANIDVWEAKSSKGTEVDDRAIGAPTWFELMTDDPARDAKFYHGLFGWAPQLMPMRDVNYTLFQQDDAPVAGMMQISKQTIQSKPRWNTYFTVADAARTVREAEKLGGKICMPPTEAPGTGTFAGIESPQGVPFWVIAYK